MKKLLGFAAIIVVMFSMSANAQFIAIQGNLSLPMGNFGDAYGMGFGGSATFMYPVADNIDLGATVGYITFSGKDLNDGVTFSTIPILVGGRVYFGDESFTPYVAAELGMHFYTISGKYELFGQTVEFDASESNFGIGFGPGFLMPIGSNVDLDVTAQYNMIMTEGESTGYVSIEAGVAIGLN